MGNVRSSQRRRQDTFASPSSLLSTRPFAPITSHPSSSLLPKDQPANPVQAKGFGYSFERMAVHRPDPEVIDRNESKPVVPGETTNLSPLQLPSDGEALAEQDQAIPTASESALPDHSSASTLQRRPTSASDPNTPKPPPVNRQTGTKRSGWSIERMAITYNPLPPAQRRATDAPTTQEPPSQTEVLQQQPAESATPRENTTGLPDHLKAGIESLSDLSLDDVHVHYNSSKPAQVDALAYTQGTEIHVGPGQERHLAHEAWHVVQQAQGRVKPTLQMKGVAINDDQGLEKEADLMGSRATEKITNADRQTFTHLEKTGTAKVVQQHVKVVQRLEPVETFKQETAVRVSPRPQVLKQIDSALVAYHTLIRQEAEKGRADLASKHFSDRNLQLHEILKLCKDPQIPSSRQQGVDTLLSQVRSELTYILPLAQAWDSTNDRDKFSLLLQGQELYLFQVEKKGYAFDESTGGIIAAHLVTIINELRQKDPDAFQPVIMGDLAELKSLRLNPNIPTITRDILDEILAHETQIAFVEGGPGTMRSLPSQNIPQEYTLKHNLMQYLGKIERVGSLAHEMTHVSVAKTFGNTDLFLSFPEPWPGFDLIKKTVAIRKDYVAELKDLSAKDQELTPRQKDLIADKLKYAGGGRQISKYVGKLREAGLMDIPTRDRIWGLLAQFPDLEGTDSLVEYDTVMNQMLVYMALWNISMANPFYTRLREIAKEAYQYRTTVGMSALLGVV